ncbi:MAG: class I SAM-dependent methyltransferase [Armatimonadota bacterium]
MPRRTRMPTESAAGREPPPDDEGWWREFFESPDSIPLSYFPGAAETRREVRSLVKLLDLTRDDLILDACCGLGRHAVPLAAEGLHLVGLDRSSMMLRRARETASRRDRQPRFVRGEASALPFRDGAFSVVLNLFNSFGYGSEQENQRVLSETARVLRPGGRFFLETRNRRRQLLAVPYQHTVRLNDGRRAKLRCFHDEASKRLVSEWRTEDDGALVHRAAIRLYELAELRHMFDSAGLRIEQLLGDYRGKPFVDWHRQLILIARQ